MPPSDAGDAADDGARLDCDAPAPPIAPDASSPADVPDSGADAGASVPAPIAFDCEAYVEVAQIRPTTCAVVDPVSHRVGHLQWVCAGGPARLRLGDLDLVGTVEGSALELATCREDPVSWLTGRYETVQVSANLVTGSGVLSFTRGYGLSCERVFADCNATSGVAIER